MSARSPIFKNLLFAVISSALLAPSLQAEPINWRSSLDAAKIEANRTGKLVLVHFYTASCGPCKKLERDVFSQPNIGAAMERDYIPVKLNADQSPAIANAFQITRVPTEVILTPQGNIVQKLSCPLEPAPYGAQLANVAQYYQQRSTNRNTSAQAPIHSAYAGLRVGQPNQAQATMGARTANNAPAVPTVTNNPYLASAPPAIRQSAPTTVAYQQPTARALPANAMPNSYRKRDAIAAAPAPAIAQRPVGVLQAPTTPPVTPRVSFAPPAAAAPPIVQTAQSPVTTTAPATQQFAAARPAAVEAWPPQLPAGAPRLAFEGFCPVSLQQAQKWIRGNSAFGAIHRGRTYLFAGEAQRQKFLAAPDAYSPVFSGLDPVKMLDEKQEVEGSRKFGFEYRNAFYLFSSKETMARFASQPDRYSAGVRQAMNRMDSSGGTIRR